MRERHVTHPLARLTRATWLGVHTAARVPRIMAGDGMASLLEKPSPPSAASVPDGDVSLATAVAFAAIRHLSRLPGARWRNTCLFRAAAECWILRANGFPAVVRIGVARGARIAAATYPEFIASGSSLGAEGRLPANVAAHAWVECAGVACQTALGGERDAYVLLESRG